MKLQLPSEFDHATDSVLIVAIACKPEAIKQQLFDLGQDWDHKPCQGLTLASEHTTQVITPVWNGKKY